MTHYVCKGECNGVSQTPGTCSADSCSEHNHDLQACDCTDSTHGTEKEASQDGNAQ